VLRFKITSSKSLTTTFIPSVGNYEASLIPMGTGQATNYKFNKRQVDNPH